MRARYRCSSEHKTHPGPWGAPQWHPRTPDLSPCPTDILSDDVPQAWLDAALQRPECWDPKDRERYVYWYGADYDRFFVARRTQEPGADGQEAQYKGYPVYDHEVPLTVAEYFLEEGIIDEDRLRRVRRAKRRERGFQ